MISGARHESDVPTRTQRIPGISQRMLTLTLRHLERDGLFSRTVATALAQWATDHDEEIKSHTPLL